MVKRSWNDDGVDGGPSSIEVLLEWLSMSGNATRWRRSAGKRDGSRAEMLDEILNVMQSYNINHRTTGSISARLTQLERELQKAENWLKSRGLHNYDVSRKTEDAVLQMCPYYSEIKSLLQTKRPPPRAVTPVVNSEIYSNDAYSSDESSGGSEYRSSCSEDDELPTVGFKRRDFGPHALHPKESIKRARLEDKLHNIKLEDTKCVAVLEPEPDERREFFKLELRVKRDEALIVRAKARKELLDVGVPLVDIDRLLPLEL